MAYLLIWRWILLVVTILLLQIRITVCRKPNRKPLEHAATAISIYFFSVVFQASLPVPVVCDDTRRFCWPCRDQCCIGRSSLCGIFTKTQSSQRIHNRFLPSLRTNTGNGKLSDKPSFLTFQSFLFFFICRVTIQRKNVNADSMVDWKCRDAFLNAGRF